MLACNVCQYLSYMAPLCCSTGKPFPLKSMARICMSTLDSTRRHLAPSRLGTPSTERGDCQFFLSSSPSASPLSALGAPQRASDDFQHGENVLPPLSSSHPEARHPTSLLGRFRRSSATDFANWPIASRTAFSGEPPGSSPFTNPPATDDTLVVSMMLYMIPALAPAPLLNLDCSRAILEWACPLRHVWPPSLVQGTPTPYPSSHL